MILHDICIAKVVVFLTFTLAMFAPSAAAAPIPEFAWARCAAMQDDRQRLACYDRLSGRRMSDGKPDRGGRSRVLDEIMARCEQQMGRYGATMVKGCVDLDLKAYKVLGRYAAEHKAVVDRCTRQMGSFGWSMVKGCADMDIKARKELQEMKRQ